LQALTETDLKELKQKSVKLRRDIISMIHNAGSGHPGGSLSVVDILIILYYKFLRVDAADPHNRDRDRLVLSKGHACPALYAILADKGFFSGDELNRLRKIGSMLQGHPDMRKTPGVDISTGSLGQGLSAANGMALGARLDNSSRRVFAILGDGETQEGQVWEAAMTAAHYRLDNLTAFLDCNGLQIDGPTKDVKSLEPLADKWRSFGWLAMEVDGHDYLSLEKGVNWAFSNKGAPSIIIARTVKGKGVSFMENRIDWHGKSPDKDKYEAALTELRVGNGGES